MKKTNSNYDIAKVILCIMIVCLHCSLFPKILFPWLRIAVPLFFMISSYFFFSKVQNEEQNKDLLLKKYVNRNIKLYIFWLILFLPFTIIIKGYFKKKNIIKGVILFVRDFLFSSTFKASWFIMATVIATTIIYITSKYMKEKKIVVWSFIIYLIVCLRSSYMFLINNFDIVRIIFNKYDTIFTSSCTSFPVALIWIVCGKLFAEKKLKWNKKTNLLLFIIGSIGLWIEWVIVKNISGNFKNDCYIFLLPLCVSIFKYIVELKPTTLKQSKNMRKISTITYASHLTIILCLNYASNKIPIFKNSFVVFITTLSICFLIYIIITRLEKKKSFKWLKYSY